MSAEQLTTVAVAIVQKNAHDDDRVLLLQRNPNAYPDTSYVDPFPRCWELIGGHGEENEQPLATAIREVREETGIVLLPEDCQFVESSPFNGGQALNWLYTVEVLEELPVVLSCEHLAYEWVALAKALSMRLAFKHSHLLAQAYQSRGER